jgi:hypothetical protein
VAPETYPLLRNRLAALRVLPRAQPGPFRDGPAFEMRRSAYSLREIFGRDPYAPDDGALYLDTETTGLAGGTGTTPFLVGLAFVEHRQVVVEQFFLRRLSGETAMLEALRDRLEEAATLVTFNGRRFDWPILEARAIIGRLRLPAPPAHHDLMGIARRLWHRPLGTYRLSVVERAIGIDRGADLDSAEIPGLYLQYLRTGEAELIEPVFTHNRHDVRCLLHLRRLARRWIGGVEDPPTPIDWDGLAVLRLAAGEEAGAEDALWRALAVDDDPAARWRAARRLARLLQHAARWDDALALWEREAGGRGAWRVRALIQASKICAWRLRNPDRALALLEDAAGIVEWLHLRGDPAAAELDADVQQRIARLRTRRPTRRRPT